MNRLREIAVVTEQRGPHAFGFAWIDQRGRLRCYKQTGRISDHLGLLAMASDARMLIGHTRFATQGDPRENINNHPHAADAGWIVHNGTIPQYQQVNDDWGLRPISDCDSETIAMLIERMDGSLAERCAGAVHEIGRYNTAVLGLWARPDRLIAVRRGNPLCMAQTSAGVYLASLPARMPKSCRPVQDDTLVEFTRSRTGELHVQKHKIEKLAAGWATVVRDRADVEAVAGEDDDFAVRSDRE